MKHLIVALGLLLLGAGVSHAADFSTYTNAPAGTVSGPVVGSGLYFFYTSHDGWVNRQAGA